MSLRLDKRREAAAGSRLPGLDAWVDGQLEDVCELVARLDWPCTRRKKRWKGGAHTLYRHLVDCRDVPAAHAELIARLHLQQERLTRPL